MPSTLRCRLCGYVAEYGDGTSPPATCPDCGRNDLSFTRGTKADPSRPAAPKRPKRRGK